MNTIKDDLEMLSVILQKGLTENKGTILYVGIKKDTAFLNIECLLDGRYWGLFCYQTLWCPDPFPPNQQQRIDTIEENTKLSMAILRDVGSIDEVPDEEMRALEDVLSNALTENKATIVNTDITIESYVSIKYKYGNREFALHSYLAKKKYQH